jgi:hypothetical protein
VFYGIITNWAGMMGVEMGPNVLSAAGYKDEVKGLLAVAAELPFVVLGLLTVALRLHV